MMARMTSDIRRLADVLAWGVVDSVWGVTMIIAIMITMLLLNWKLALVTLTVVPLLLVISLFFQQKILKRRRVRINSRITANFNEGIGGAKTTKKPWYAKPRIYRNSRRKPGAMFRSSVQAVILASLYLPSVLTLASIGTGLALWYGGQQVLLARISYGTLVAFLSYTVLFFDPIRDLGAGICRTAIRASLPNAFSQCPRGRKCTDRPEGARATAICMSQSRNLAGNPGQYFL